MSDTDGTTKGTLLCSCSDTIKLWDIQKQTLIKTFEPHQTPSTINCVTWNHSNQVIASGGNDGKIALSHTTGHTLGTLSVTDENDNGECIVLSLCFSTNSRYLCSGDTNSCIKVWDLKRKELIRTFKTHQGYVNCTRFSGNDQHIASSSSTGEVFLHSLMTGQMVASLRSGPFNDTQSFKDLQFSPFRKSLLAGCNDEGSVFLWDTTARTLHASFVRQHHAPVSAIAFSPVNHLLFASAGLDKKIIFYDVVDKKVVKVISCDEPLTALSFMDNGTTIACGTASGKIQLYDLKSGSTPIVTFIGHSPFPVNCLSFQHSERKASKSADSSVILSGTTKIHDMSSLSTPAPKESPKSSRAADSNLLRTVNRDDMELFSPLRTASIPETPVTSSIRNNAAIRSNAKPPLSTPLSTNFTTTPSIPSRFSEDPRGKSHKSSDSTVPNDTWNESLSTQPSTSMRDTFSKLTKPDAQPNSVFSPLATAPSATKSKQTNQASRFSSELFSPLGAKHPSTDTIALESIRKLSSGSTSQPVVKSPRAETISSAADSPSDVEVTPFKEAQKPKFLVNEAKKVSPPERQTETARPHSTSNSDRPKVPEPNMTQANPTMDQNFSQFQRQLLQSVVEECLESFRQSIHQDIQNLHLELLRQFQAQQNEIMQLFEHYFDPKSRHE